MQYIQTRPDISESDLIDLAAKIALFNTPYVDGNILSSLMKTAYYCGLKKGALLALNICDVIDKWGNIRDSILGHIPINDVIRAIFLRHLEHLKAKCYLRYRSSPLFPNKKRGRYGSRQLQYDLKKCMKGVIDNNGLETIRQSGICRYYERMKEEGKTAWECMKETERFSHCTTRHVEGILKNQIIPAGKKIDPLWNYYENIEDIQYGRIKVTDEKIRAFKDDIERDPKLSKKRKLFLLAQLDRVSNKAPSS